MKTAGRSPGNRGPSSFLSRRARRAHLLTTCKAGGGIPPVGQAHALLTNCLPDSSPEGAGNVASEHSLCSRLYILRYQQNDGAAYCHPIPPPACENLPPAASSGCLATKKQPNRRVSLLFRNIYSLFILSAITKTIILKIFSYSSRLTERYPYTHTAPDKRLP